jgi:predicted NAD/FAD-dependent oxidoreductase
MRRAAYRTPRRVAVIGAELSGLMRARTLADHSIEVIVFEKSRGYGGRFSRSASSSISTVRF